MKGSSNNKLNQAFLAATKGFGFDSTIILQEFGAGNINQTYLLTDKAKNEQWILQSVNPIFPPQIHSDIAHLFKKMAVNNLLTAQLKPSVLGLPYFKQEEAIWRCQSFISGDIYEKAPNAEICYQGGKGLAQLQKFFKSENILPTNHRKKVHDPVNHLKNLKMTVQQSNKKLPALFYILAQGTEELLKNVLSHKECFQKSEQGVHGDPKLNNLIFENDKFKCFIDFDTLGTMNPTYELGDALRSWCNDNGEEDAYAGFNKSFLNAAISGYEDILEFKVYKPNFLLACIALELSTRFLKDAIDEIYFKWNSEKYHSSEAHNIQRAKVQLDLATQAFYSDKN